MATLPEFRGRGLQRQLSSYAEKVMAERGGEFCCLVPAEESLFRFYEKQGYVVAFTRTRTVFPGGEPISAADYVRLRAQILTVPHMVYDLRMLEYAAEVYGLTFYRTATGIAAAGEHYTAEVLPEDAGGAPFAMIKWLAAEKPLKNAYLGLPLE